MDYPLVKFHLLELLKLFKQGPYNSMFDKLYIDAKTVLNSHPLKDTKQKEAPSNIAIIAERKRRQALENLLKKETRDSHPLIS